MQGAGAIGVASLAGNVVTAAGGSSTAQTDSAAIRVVHASPDTPTIQVSVSEAGATDGMGGTETPDGEAATDGGVGATATPTGGEAGTPGGDEPLVEDLEFSEVSGYQEVEPGTYQLQVTATESSGLLDEIFGGDEEEQVVLDQEIEIGQGTTYTAVAYGLLAQRQGPGQAGGASEGAGADGGEMGGGESDEATGGDMGDDVSEEAAGGEMGDDIAGGEMGGTEGGNVLIDQLAYGETASFEAPAQNWTLEFRETSSGDAMGGGATGDGTTGDTETGSTQQSDRGLTLAVLEDDLSAPGAGGDGAMTTTTESDDVLDGEETTTESVETTAIDAGDQTGQARVRVFHAVPDVDAMQVVAVEDDGGETTTESPEGTPGAPEDESGGETQEVQSGRVERAEVTLEGGAVYGGFAMGYFDPESATQQGGAAGGETPVADGETPAADGEDEGDGILDGGDGETTGTPGADGGVSPESVPEGFQLVTVETARDGERVDDGGSDGGLF